MKILVVGAGGREHAIIKKLKENPRVDAIYCAPGNGGIAKDAQCVNIKATDLDSLAAFAQDEKMDLVVVAPDDPLVLGLVDMLKERGIRAFGPSKLAARIEGSKVFAKELMKKYNIPTAKYEVFTNSKDAMRYIEREDSFPMVIKADGLALGKGVMIAQTRQEAANAIHSMMEDRIFGSSGSRVVIEEFLTGPEVSVLAFCDGKTVKPMLSSMDHKRALDGDEGLNTGGMGTIAPNPCYTPALAQECMKTIFKPTVEAMQKEGCPFQGCLYFGLMMTPKGPKVIEYNCRFGDPETQVVLPMLKTDLLTIMDATIDQTLDQLDIEWETGACACVIAASGGYPQSYKTGFAISGLDEMGQVPGATIYHAGTRLENGEFQTCGGRVLGVCTKGNDLTTALEKAYEAIGKISFENMHYRHDIGHRALMSK